jgi:hypothetical protein
MDGEERLAETPSTSTEERDCDGAGAAAELKEPLEQHNPRNGMIIGRRGKRVHFADSEGWHAFAPLRAMACGQQMMLSSFRKLSTTCFLHCVVMQSGPPSCVAMVDHLTAEQLQAVVCEQRALVNVDR